MYNEVSASLIYGRFEVEHDEVVREALSPFSKQKVLETKNHFAATRAILDLALGIQYSALICDCAYGISVQLGWEEHLFFHQNQMWRVNRVGNNANNYLQPFPNNGGENVHFQRRGTLSTYGWTLSFKFDF